jgi:S-adenosylmethionine-diacylglycerol 3-amino-3-carboxypropyl transferase
LELKLAGARTLEYEDFFALFGQGRAAHWDKLYRQTLRKHLPEVHRPFWDKHGELFINSGRRKSFYFRGTSGTFAWLVNYYIDRIAKLRDSVNALLAADCVEQQRDIFEQYNMSDALWKPFLKWAMKRDMTLALLGVPRSQRRQIDDGYPGGIFQFVVDRVETVFTKLPLKDNYFWRVYLTGHYTPECCPEYLKPQNFQALKDGVAERVTTHTASLLSFLKHQEQPVTRFVLLDHMDWLVRDKTKRILAEEWQAILQRAAPTARVLWRSAGLSGEFINPIKVTLHGRKRSLGDHLQYHRDLAGELHAKDRVHTYGSFCIADIRF